MHVSQRLPSRLRHALPGVTLALLSTAVVAGCGSGAAESPDPQPINDRVVRTPSPVGTDMPSTDPPIIQRLPGASGGPPGSVAPSDPPASPGQ